MKKHSLVNLSILGLLVFGSAMVYGMPNSHRGTVSVLGSNAEPKTEAPKASSMEFQGIMAIKSEGGKDGQVPSWFEYDINPGGTATGKILLQNRHPHSNLVADMYVVGSNLAQSVFSPNSRVEPGPDAAWVSLKPMVPVKAGESLEVPFTINVPKNATPGSHVLAIMTETAADALEEEKVAKGNSSKVTIATSIGLRVYINVSGKLQTSAKIGELVLLSETPYAFKISIVNTGNTIIRPQVQVEAVDTIRDDVIAITNKDKRYEFEILPGGKSDMNIQWDYDKMGIYMVNFKVLYNGKTEARSMKIVIYPSLKEVAMAIGGLLVLALIIFNVVYLIRKRNSQDVPSISPPPSNDNPPPPPQPLA